MRTRYLLLLAPLLASASTEQSAVPRDFTIRTESVALDPLDPGRTRVGRLRYLAGWVLRGDSAGFGGVSSLCVTGDAVTMLSDAGGLIRFRLAGGRKHRATFDLLPGLETLHGSLRDSESMTTDPRTGRVWIGFEHGNVIRRYPPGFGAMSAIAQPPAMAAWPDNGGPEAMVAFPDGRLLVFSEHGGDSATEREALLFPSDPTLPDRPEPLRFRYRTPMGLVPTDAALLPDGRVLVLHRGFSLLGGVRAALAIVDPRAIAEGAVVQGEVIARLAPPLTVDNMEGLAVTREAGRTIVWLASDDNFLPIQRTLLLKFALDERAPRRR